MQIQNVYYIILLHNIHLFIISVLPICGVNMNYPTIMNEAVRSQPMCLRCPFNGKSSYVNSSASLLTKR